MFKPREVVELLVEDEGDDNRKTSKFLRTKKMKGEETKKKKPTKDDAPVFSVGKQEEKDDEDFDYDDEDQQNDLLKLE